MSDQQIEEQIQASGKTAPRVTPADLEKEIREELYATGDYAFPGCSDEARVHLQCLTICCLVLSNGCVVTGTSACVSPENFDRDIGRAAARNKAIDQVWPLLGFRLRDQLASDATADPDDDAPCTI